MSLTNARANTSPQFPSQTVGSAPVKVTKVNGIWTVKIDISVLASISPLVSEYATDYLLVWVSSTNIYARVALSSLGFGGGKSQRSVTASPIVVAPTDQLLNININAGAPTCALPTAASRVGIPLTFKDVGGQAFVHNITITPNGAETIDGQPTFVININRQGVTLWPFSDGVNSGWFVL